MAAGTVSPSDIGHVSTVAEVEYGETTVINFQANAGETNRMTTIVVRASSRNLLDDAERAINDGVNVYRQFCKDPRLVPGGGCTEIALARKLSDYADTISGLEQYAIRAYAEAFEIIVGSLAANSGRLATDVVADLYAAQAAGKTTFGVNTTM